MNAEIQTNETAENSANGNKRIFCLGVNKKTGRLGWCPDCPRVLLLIPIAMVLIICIYLLLSQWTNTFSTATDTSSNTLVSDDNGLERAPRCIAIRAGMKEVLDLEEREVLKDLRTSFIPPDPLIVPSNCKINEILRYPSVSKDHLHAERELKLLNFIRRRRRRRELEANQTEILLPEGEKRDTAAEQEEPWKIEVTHPPLGAASAELDETEIGLVERTDSIKTPFIHTFWKGEGTSEKIRSTQAEVMKQYMDTSVDPCTDFYQYACGNWERLNPIPKDKAAYDTFEILRESLDNVLKDLLLEEPINRTNVVGNEVESPSSTTTPPPSRASIRPKDALDVQNSLETLRALARQRRSFGAIYEKLELRHAIRKRELHKNFNFNSNAAEIKARNLFLSCMNYKLLEERGIQPLHDLLKTLGGWPALDPNWTEDGFDWLNLTAHLRLYNNDIFLVEWVGPDIKNSEENVIQFDQTSLGLPTREYFLLESNSAYLEAYREFMTTVIKLLGADLSSARKTSDEIIDFEVKLANITAEPGERTNVSLLYKRMTVSSLHEEIPQIDWQRYLTVVLERPINTSETVVIFAIDYMKDLVSLLSKTEPRIVANYLLWRFVRHRVNNLDDRFQEAKQRFYFALFGREESPPRWKNCVAQVNSNMGMALGSMFVRKYFDETSKQDTMILTHELQQAFREILNATDWIDAQTKALAELKVNAMSLRIGYPDYILSHENLNEKYQDLEIDADKYFENTLNVLRHLTRTEQNKLGQIVNKTAWHTSPAVVNAYYSRNKNQIMFPAGILQPPFYHRHFPKCLNYGGIGVVIGHELTHGFDDKGRLFDREGNLHRWWSETAIENFHKRANCLVFQYGNYTVKEVGIAVDGENTQGENIADNGGIKQAFRAYKKWLDRQSDPEVIENERLPGLNATSAQLFFLNFAQVWCGGMRPEATKNKLKTAVHSPGKFRVIGTVSNSEDFAREYNCPPGSPMNPKIKCTVW